MPKELLNRVRLKVADLTMLSVFPEESIHAENTLEWVLKLHPEAGITLQIAALGHDIERSFDEKRIVSSDYETYDEYKQAHALNSAQIFAQILEEMGVDQEMVDDVAHLVANHESGGDERSEILKDADTLSFFHVNLPFFYDRKGADITRKRCVWAYKHLPEDLHIEVEEFDYMDEELRALVHDCLSMDEPPVDG